MRKTLFVLALFCVLFATGTADRPLASSPRGLNRASAALVLPPQANQAPAAVRSTAIRNLGKMLVYFIPNDGQIDCAVDFYVQGKDKAVYFTPEGVTFALSYGTKHDHEKNAPEKLRVTKADDPGHGPDVRHEVSEETKRWAVKMDFVGARKEAKPEGVDKTGTVISYFKGKPEDWHAGLEAYGKIIYRDLWPGTDLVYRGDIDELKYEFVVHPGADPAAIKMALRGVERAAIDDAGRLEISTPAGRFEDETPLAYQNIEGKRTEVPMAFKLAEAENGRNEKPDMKSYSYGFEVGGYDKRRDLVLDPATIVYCGYIGGSANEDARGIAVDGSDCAYIAGDVYSDEGSFPVTAGPDLTKNGDWDAFIAKVKADGTGLVYCGYIGGSDDDYSEGIAVDAGGNAYVTGETYSSQMTFPVIVGPDLTFNGASDLFVAKVNSIGTALVYCGYIGGSLREGGDGIAVDVAGNAYIVGATQSTETTFPTTVGPDLSYNGGPCDVFVAKVKADGSGLVYCGYIGGSLGDLGRGIAVDGSGNAYVTGYTCSTQNTFPVIIGPDLTFNGGYNDNDAFVAKVNAGGKALVYCGYIGGSDDDYGKGIAVDGSGYAYVTGETDSSQMTFPVIVGPDLTFNGASDLFVAKVNLAGTALVYCGYIGGSWNEYGNGIAVDAGGNAYVTGETDSSETTFPATFGPDLTFNGNSDGFIAKVSVNGGGLVYCGYVGGSLSDRCHGIAIDSSGNAYVTGEASSSQTTFPVIVGPDLTYNGSYQDVFVAKIQKVFTLAIIAGTGGTTSPIPGTHTYDEGTSVSVQAVPASAYKFGFWSGDASGSTNPVSFVMSRDKAIQANFTRVVQAPIGLTAERLANRSVSMIEYVARLRWQANSANTGTITYRVYQIENGKPIAVANIGSGTFEYIVRRLQKTKSYRFGVTAVNSLGLESDMVEVTA